MSHQDPSADTTDIGDIVDVGDDEAHLTMATVDRPAVGEVSKLVQLVDVRTATMSATVSPHFVFEEAVPASWTEHAVIGYDTHLAGRVEDDPFRFRVLAYFFAHFDRDWVDRDPDEIDGPPEDRPPDVEIDSHFVLEYELDAESDVTDEDLRHFAFFNGTFNAWPYWREYAQDASAKLGLTPALIVPVFRVPKIG